MKSYALKWYR